VACVVAYEAGYETNHGGEDDDDVVDGDVNPRNNIVDNILPYIRNNKITPNTTSTFRHKRRPHGPFSAVVVVVVLPYYWHCYTAVADEEEFAAAVAVGCSFEVVVNIAAVEIVVDIVVDVAAVAVASAEHTAAVAKNVVVVGQAQAVHKRVPAVIVAVAVVEEERSHLHAFAVRREDAHIYREHSYVAVVVAAVVLVEQKVRLLPVRSERCFHSSLSLLFFVDYVV